MMLYIATYRNTCRHDGTMSNIPLSLRTHWQQTDELSWLSESTWLAARCDEHVQQLQEPHTLYASENAAKQTRPLPTSCFLQVRAK